MLVRDCDWTEDAAQELVRVVNDYGYEFLRNAAALAIAAGAAEGILGQSRASWRCEADAMSDAAEGRVVVLMWNGDVRECRRMNGQFVHALNSAWSISPLDEGIRRVKTIGLDNGKRPSRAVPYS